MRINYVLVRSYMHLYRKFKRICVCDRLIRLQTHSLYEKHNTQTSAVQHSYITHWYVGLMFKIGQKKNKKNYTCMQHFSCPFSLGLVSLNFWNGMQGNPNSDISVIKLVFTYFWILSIAQYSEQNTPFWKLYLLQEGLIAIQHIHRIERSNLHGHLLETQA